MTIDDVALVAFGHLVQKDNTYGLNEEARDKVAQQAYQYAEAFLKAKKEWHKAHPVKVTAVNI